MAASPDESTPWGPNQAARSIHRGYGAGDLPPSRSLHPVMAVMASLCAVSVGSPGVQVRTALHGSEYRALTGGRHSA
jgi:hypothetical protein